ncbi:hypothetical protein AgCh_038446 [Apium graveolens]
MEIILDRALTNESWLNNFPMAKLHNLEGAPSDHSAILLVPQVLNRGARKYRFKFENAWLTEPMCEQLREIFWRQRSKQLWLQDGDKNSKYFHKTASGRRRNNHIQKLQDDNGNWLDWEHGLPELVKSYFNNLFKASNTEYEEVLERVSCSITDIQNAELLRPVVEEEVKAALFQMNPDKVPGPDGMTPAFFQRHWRIVGENVVKVVQEFFTKGDLNSDLNVTNIVLIPKKKSPSLMNDLRPISLCNVLVKIITKVAANRLKATLESVISENQSAFMAGRLISDNVMISNEVMHYLKRKRRGKEGHMAIKLDMSKAYDRIEWSFLRAILSKIGYNEWWIHLILTCVSTVSYKVTHENKDIGPIVPSRGIRRGDPLSPYLFIIFAQGLSSLIQRYKQKSWIQGVKVCRQAPSITHMLFADDSYLFCKANGTEVEYILRLLKVFEKASGQKVNLSKSVVFFSSNIDVNSRSQLCYRLNMVEVCTDSTYLGLPNMMQKSKVATLGYLRGKVKKKVLAWDGCLVSQGGKEVLVKAVAQALLTYAMSVFLLPAEIQRDIEHTISKFWWNKGSGDKKGIHWMSWDRLSKHKSAGRMGFRDFRDFNIVLLGKQAWRFLSQPSSMVSKVFIARYFPTVGTGEDISVLRQPWLGDRDHPYIDSCSPQLENRKVSSLMMVHQNRWNEEILKALFNEWDQECIKKTKLTETGGRDSIYRCHEKNGDYSVKSAYKLLQVQKSYWRRSDSNSLWSKIWRIKAPAKGQGETLSQWWENVVAKCDNKKKEEVADVCWSLWKARNELVWNKKALEGDGEVSWVKPQESEIKVSVDAALFEEFNTSGIGLVARDSEGEMIMAKTICIKETLDPEMAEVIAIKEALSWTEKSPWQHITVESDCLLAVQSIRSKTPMLSPFGRMVKECRRLLPEQNTVSLSFIKRSANIVAHELARASYFFPDREFDRRSVVPIEVDVALKADLC